MSPSKLGDAVDRVKSAVGRDGDVPSAEGAEGPIAVVRGALRAWGEGNFDEFFQAFDGDVEWIAPTGKFPAGGTVQGRDELREKFTSGVEDAYEDFGFRPEHFLEADEVDWVVVLGTFQGTPLKGHELDAPGVMVWEFDGERAERVRVYTDSESFHDPAPSKEEQERKERERQEEKEREESGDDEARGESDDDGPQGEGSSNGARAESDADESGDERGEHTEHSEHGEEREQERSEQSG